VLVGIYLHPMMNQTLTPEAQTLVGAEAFKQMGGVRKAYAKVSVRGITEPISAYIVPQIADLTVAESENAAVVNIRAYKNAPYVHLFPYSDPTKIVRPKLPEETCGHHVAVSYETDGVPLSHLEAGSEVRLFNSLGMPVYVGKAGSPAIVEDASERSADATTLFIPLGSHHGVYILSAGGEVFKFQY
jgi:hypothetical protein